MITRSFLYSTTHSFSSRPIPLSKVLPSFWRSSYFLQRSFLRPAQLNILLNVGDLVNVPGGMHGTVKYLGGVAGKPGKFAGIELATEHARRGKNNGDVEGKKYFNTSVPGSGIFVPMNSNKYVTKRSSAASTVSTGPPTPSRPVNFSKSVGPGTTVSRPRVRRPSLPRAESPRAVAPSKLGLNGLRTTSTGSRTGPSPNGYPRSPIKAPSRLSDRPPSRVSVDDDYSSVRTSDAGRGVSSAELQDLKDQIKSLERQLLDRDKQLDEQASTLGEFQHTLEELEGSDALSIRAQLREKNERIVQLTSEFDLHRADFRSTLDTLEIAASETERVYEQRLEELLQQNKELHERGEDVEAVARQLKQLEELVSELEEGLEDARRGEAEARAEVEFLRGEVERTKLELKKERDMSAAVLQDAHSGVDGPGHSKELDQKDDEIRGLKAIIHSLSRGDPNLATLQNGLSGGPDPEHVAHLEQRIQEYEDITDNKSYRIEELERQLRQMQLNGHSRHHSSTITASPAKHHKPSSSTGNIGNLHSINHAHRLSDRTVVPNDWHDQPGMDDQHHPFSHRRGASESSRHRLETMHESESPSSDDGNSLWCEICEEGGHDILSCTNMFGADNKNKDVHAIEEPQNESHAKTTPETSAAPTHYSSLESHDGHDGHDSHNSNSTYEASSDSHKAGLEALKGISGVTASMSPVAGKASGVVDETKWCALCERDGHESIDCPFDE
ncbi:hypothetical protein AWENTII_006031 [Aspergillus wentii]